MAKFDSDTRGGVDDRIRLQLGGDDVLIAENYEVHAGILSQPAGFSLRLGHGSVVKDVIQKYQPLTPFKLYIGTVLQQTGNVDGIEASGTTGATEITFTGRDSLAPLHDSEIDAEESFNNATYTQLVQTALKRCGLNSAKLVASAQADRSIRAGVPLTEFSPAVAVQVAAASVPDTRSTIAGVVKRPFQTKIGERWFGFVRRAIDRAGFFLWAGADGTFILSAPNVNTKPVYKIVRRRGQTRNEVNVEDALFRNDTAGRHTAAVIYGRGGGGRHGRSKSIAASSDDEMQFFASEAFGRGAHRLLVIRDANVHTREQAEFLGARKLAEERRNGWRLEYTLSGHTTPTIGGTDRAVWVPDTLVQVIDDEFGLDDTYWIESCVYARHPETTTKIRLMRRIDLQFGDTSEEEA